VWGLSPLTLGISKDTPQTRYDLDPR